MSEFTEKPWVAIGNSVYGPDGDRLAFCDTVTVYGDTKANAQLISAAPDMYEALGTVVKEGWLVGSPLESVCRQALAKARGEKGEGVVIKDKLIYKDGEPCDHPGCKNNIRNACEMCGRFGCRGEVWQKGLETRYYMPHK